MWGASEADIKAAGGYGVAEGYHTIQFAGVGADFQVIKDINAMYQAQGKPVPNEQEISVFYNRGVMIAAIHAEAVRNAIKAKGGAKPTGEDVKKGMEAIKGFTLGGMVPPMEITEATTRAAAGCRCGPSRAASSSRTATGSRPTATCIKKHLAAIELKSLVARMKRRGRAKARPSERNPGEGIAGSRCATSGQQNAKDTPMLSINNIEVVYDNVILVLRGVSLEVEARLHHDAARRQRRRQDHHAEGGLRRAAHRARRGHQGQRHASRTSASTACAPST